MDLEKYRRQIDLADEEIVRLLNQRMEAARRIGEAKEKAAVGLYVPAREREVLDRVCELNQGPLLSEHMRNIYREIMSASICLEGQATVAFLGPLGTYSHQAAFTRFGHSLTYQPNTSISDVFTAVENGRADYGVVPIENSIEGGVTHTQDLLTTTPLKICAEIYLPVNHALLVGKDSEKIRKVYSKFQALAQCRRWLEHHCPGAEAIPVSSTARGAEMAAGEAGAAAVAAPVAADIYGLDIRAESIQDVSGNTTRFLVLGHEFGKSTPADKTSIFFSVQHQTGALFDSLLPFREAGLNLTKIESRPSKVKAWEYLFFVDFEGHADDEKVKTALAQLAEHCSVLSVLGSYPRAPEA